MAFSESRSTLINKGTAREWNNNMDIKNATEFIPTARSFSGRRTSVSSDESVQPVREEAKHDVQRPRKAPREGYTLIQLTIALSIISILTALSLPQTKNFLENSWLKTAAERFYSDMQFVRSEAIKNNSTITVDLQPGTTWCYGIDDNSACNCGIIDSCLLNGAEKSIQSSEFNSITMSTSGVTGNTLQFDGVQNNVTNNGTISFAINSKSIDVEVSPIGRVRLCSQTIAGYKSC